VRRRAEAVLDAFHGEQAVDGTAETSLATGAAG
jgi:hypothetical protein